jgi:hypothetical protein
MQTTFEELPMSLMIVSDALKARLAAASHSIELCAEDGTLLGVFTPNTEKKKYNLEPKISNEEIQRRLATEKGRPLKDIMRDLEARG